MNRDLSFGPKRRIKRRKDFLRIQGEGRKLRSANLLLSISRRAEGETDCRLGITVTTKVNKRAVDRNRFKRRVRDIFRKIRSEISFPVDIVVIALNGSTELDYKQVRDQFLTSLEKVRLLKSKARGN